MSMHPMVRHILSNPALRAAVERGLAARGQGGDTMIAHLNPAEAAMLRAMGGSGTVNPRTGIRQFYADEGGGFGKDNGPNGGGFGGEGGSGPGVSGPDRSGGGAADRARMSALESKALSPPGNFGASLDYGNFGDIGWGDRAGTALASMLGFNEKQPSLTNTSGYADWGFDPAGLIGGVAGTAAGIPGMGFAADKLSQILGRPLESNLGSSVFGGTVGGSNPNPTGFGGLFGGSGSSSSSGASGPGAAGGFSGGAGNGGLGGGGLLGGASGPGGNVGGNGNNSGRQWNGLLGGANQGWAGTPTPPTTPTGQPGGSVPTAPTGTPAAAAPGAASAPPSLVPLLSQQPLAGDPFGGRFGPTPAFAQQPYQIGTQPDSFPVPTIPATNPAVTVGQGGQYGQLADKMLKDTGLQTALGQLGYLPTSAGTFPPGTLARIMADPQALTIMRQMGYQV